jgi:hypothetical protein
MITLEEYKEAQQIVKDHRVCGNGGHGCGKVFKKEELNHTIQYGAEYYWCAKCYPAIKNDW